MLTSSFYLQTPDETPGEQNGKEDVPREGIVTYGIDDIPPWYLCIFMALQVIILTDTKLVLPNNRPIAEVLLPQYNATFRCLYFYEPNLLNR